MEIRKTKVEQRKKESKLNMRKMNVKEIYCFLKAHLRDKPYLCSDFKIKKKDYGTASN
ncbi:hypothetical protein EVA_16480 [gut metagenome]|uniref:Uncharacterized protein n=1 Tax=gut metagenome TaxID=749906 RepID=J9G0S7_9ZZZZ